MPEKVALQIELTAEERQQYEALARQRGYRTLEAFLRALLEAAVDDQAYFWTEEWQAAERKVDEEIAAGQYKDFETMDDFLADLKNDE